jgi:hypothetical protein
MHSSGSAELEAEWTLVVRGKKKSKAPKAKRTVRGWDADKCTYMPKFDNEQAEEIVSNLSFRKPEFVTTSAGGETRYAYQYYYAPGGEYRLCVCAHIHKDNERKYVGGWLPGHAFICGWEGWQTETPWKVVDQIRALDDGGTFPPDKERYPVGGD